MKNRWPCFISLFGLNLISVTFLLLSQISVLFSQSLDNLKEQQPVTLNGYISTNQLFSTQPQDTLHRINYNGYYTGSLNISFYGINIPFTFTYSSKKFNYTHPFNQFGLHPSYKWIKSHIGYANMSFTPYTLNGHLFWGIGIEADPPGLFRGCVMLGRLTKAVEYDSVKPQNVPAYRRSGYGFKVGIAKDNDFVDITLFRAGDDANSISELPDQYNLMPQENAVMSVSFCKSFFDNIVFSGEYANSYITTDSRAENRREENIILKPTAWFIPVNATTIKRNAFKTNLTYNRQRYTIGAGYERIDPEYTSFGTYYFSNNLENMTVNFSVNFFESKLVLSGNTGIQRDNLDESKMNNNKRFVGSANVNAMPDEKINLNVSYSNFLNYTNVKSVFDYINETDPYENWDTLNYRQISQNVNFSGSYQFGGNKDKRQSVNLNLTYQTSEDIQNDQLNSVTSFYNASASYMLNLLPQNLSATTSINLNCNETGSNNASITWGPVLSVSKLFLNKTLRTTITGSYNTTNSEQGGSSANFNIRLGTSYTLKKQHNFNLSYMGQSRKSNNKTDFNSTLTIGYIYNFNIIKQKGENNE
jgi:hypothetical protein